MPYSFLTSRSDVLGNCLYSSVAQVLYGKNILCDELRALTAIELFLNPAFYASHALFIKFSNEESVSTNRAFNMSISNRTIELNLSAEEAVKHEAIRICTGQAWSSFLCLLGLSSAIKKPILSLYPDIGQHLNKALFNNEIKPRADTDDKAPINILFCKIAPLKDYYKKKSNISTKSFCTSNTALFK